MPGAHTLSLWAAAGHIHSGPGARAPGFFGGPGLEPPNGQARLKVVQCSGRGV